MTDLTLSRAPLRNWSGTHRYAFRELHHPESVDQLAELVAGGDSLGVLGTRHSFNGIADAAVGISLDVMPARIAVDHAASTVSCPGGATYGALAAELQREGLALANLASLPHISVGGAVATGSHGSGDENGNLATAVRAFELVTSAGEIVEIGRGDDWFDALAVSLGAAGVVTRLTLEVEPTYEVGQYVYERLGWDALADHFDAIFAEGYSVSLFTQFGADAGDVWVKARSPGAARDDLFGARAAEVEHHPVPGQDPANCTSQLGVPGPWWERLSHFRMDFRPSTGAEIQSEFSVARADAAEAIDRLRALAAVIGPPLQTAEVRTIAADRLWMSPQYDRDAVAFHFTWHDRPAEVRHALARIEAALAPLGARPHWGKLFVGSAATIGPLYEHRADYLDILREVDPRGAFRRPWLAEVLGDTASG